MLELRGAPALSAYQRKQVLSDLKIASDKVSDIYAEYMHFVSVSDELAPDELNVLNQLLHYGPKISVESTEGTLFLVIPRPGTISPWSSKATDIAHRCALNKVNRIERGIAYYLRHESKLDMSERRELSGILADRMTQAVYHEMAGAELLFGQSDPRPLTRIDVQSYGESALQEANKRIGLALTDDEIQYLAASFLGLGRDPSDAELMMFAQANSEHCRHKIFNASWDIDGEDMPRSLFSMIKNTHEMNREGVLSAYKDNAAVIEGYEGARFFPEQDGQLYSASREPVHILMKVETHNHPTAISPFSGASTGSGGEIRDEGATGIGAKPKAGLVGFSVSNLKIPGFEQPWEQDFGKPERIASALDIMLEGPIGGAAFNNEFGRPNLCGYFRTLEVMSSASGTHEVRGYHKPVMIAGGMGNIRDEHVQKSTIDVGSHLIVLGGPAMLIGLGGGAASSMDSGESSEDLDFASVQRENPEMQRRCQEVIDRCWQMGADNPIAFIHDVGAGGLSNALPELVKDGERGGTFEIRNIPNDEPGMAPHEIWCNESQERYVLAVNDGSLDRFKAICERERCPYAVVGNATEAHHLKLSDSHFENAPVDLPMSVLFGKPPKMHRSHARVHEGKAVFDSEVIDIQEAAKRILKLPGVASKNFLITIGDRSVTGLVARDQMVGPWQVPVADAAVTITDYEGYTGEAMAMGECAPVALVNAPSSGRKALGEVITNIACARIEDLSKIRLSANWMCAAGHPGEDANLYDTVHALGMELCPDLGITIPVGKDSMSMKTTWSQGGEEHSVTAPLSLVLTGFAPVSDVRKTLTPQLKLDQGDSVLLLIDLANGQNRLGGSALAQVYAKTGAVAPDLDSPELIKAFFTAIQRLNQNDRLLAYHDRSDGGLFVTLCEMAFAGRCGIDIELSGLAVDKTHLVRELFNEELGVVIQVKQSDLDEVNQVFASHDLSESIISLGQVSAEQRLVFSYKGEELIGETRAELQQIWAETSYRMQALRDNPETAQSEFEAIKSADTGLKVDLTFDPNTSIVSPFIKQNRPKAAVLREQGVNGQVEMAAAFTKAGFDAFDVTMSDLESSRFDLKDFQLIAACGGFSYGDVLGAGEGWAKSILFNARLRDMFAAFFERENTLALGVCNGCQMMSNLRSLIPGVSHWPHFVRNYSNQFEARTSLVKIEKSQAIMLEGMAGSVMPVAVAHGEGRAEFSSDEQRQSVQVEGQVAVSFVESDGRIATRYPFNPNGSPEGITGLTNQSGRALIMMPHPERVFRVVQNSWYPNSESDRGAWLRIFENAAKHFQ